MRKREKDEKVNAAYSEGFDTSVILKWLINKDTMLLLSLLTFGQTKIIERAAEALAIGASKVIIEDLRREFVH